ncbi:DUF317 domain-containing protein [Streptomyces sp. NPDC059255]|uniref:DUF317 domain-containing protein n=1 Tax=Streptomyces sp. NPDC059255 TaxID=3346793 RepID=UPI0036A05CAF
MTLDDDRLIIDGDVHVSPRYLARSTAIGDPALAPLLDLGWELSHDDLGNAYVNAPDRRVRLGYLPEAEDDGLWRINAYKAHHELFNAPAWGVCFNSDTPTEFVRAFTTALATAYEQGPEAYLATPEPLDEEREPFLVVTPLLHRGWELDKPEPDVFTIRPADRLAALEITTGPLDPEGELTSRTARWHLWAGTSINRPVWYATASTNTPVALLAALTACVSDPAPLPRWREETFSYTKSAQLAPILPPQSPVPTPLDIQRVAASRRPAALPAHSVPRWSTNSRPALPGPRR